MPTRLEVYEKYAVESTSGYSAEWWRENMPYGTTPPDTTYKYGYRRTMILVDAIERPIEIPKNKKELYLRLKSGDTMVIRSNYDDFCIYLHDIEEQCLIEDELRIRLATEISNDENGFIE